MTEATNPRIADFLAGCGWLMAGRAPLAGDASGRRFERLDLGGKTAILMIGPSGAAVRRFVDVARWLRDQGYSAPEILAADPASGLILVEDLGDALVARLVRDAPDRERELYSAAIHFLDDLARRPVPDFLPVLDSRGLGGLAELAVTAYAEPAGLLHPARHDLGPELARACQTLDGAPRVVSLRDFHAENLIWLPDRSGIARLGLIDFQDAVVTHPAYDFVSLTRDARRDVRPGLVAQLAGLACDLSGRHPEDFAADCALIGVQRSLRILGVFGRLCLEAGKPAYLDLMPRVWAYLMADLSHPALGNLRELVLQVLPEPTPGLLRNLCDRCQTIPVP